MPSRPQRWAGYTKTNAIMVESSNTPVIAAHCVVRGALNGILRR